MRFFHSAANLRFALNSCSPPLVVLEGLSQPPCPKGVIRIERLVISLEGKGKPFHMNYITHMILVIRFTIPFMNSVNDRMCISWDLRRYVL